MQTAVIPQVIELLITGLPESGKSTFVQNISTNVRDAQGWYCGDVSVDEQLQLKLLEPPRLRQFDFVWLRDLIEHISVPGIIVMCDSARPEYFGALVALLEVVHYNHPDTPCILVTNKQDLDGAWSADDIRLGLGIPDFIHVMPCRATNRNDVKRVVVEMLYKLFR
ncbi:MAG: hypothetical protein EA396_15090 [Anaerolineaceae bacterium]|nr:MAG: hypothetical protein EA396_15090 [Anaerolineaceae bacterium]